MACFLMQGPLVRSIDSQISLLFS